ncbi:short chain dehydrogenase/reductase [Nemania serpens]|nr:short chain dehydrogenase/reductase [Nemania serpens]
MDSFKTFTSALGAGLVLYISYKLVDAVWLYTRPSRIGRYLYPDASGRRAWAMVTGSSDGIGRCLALELAGHGFNVVLHGRDRDKLDAVRRELGAAHPAAETRVAVADAAECHRPDAVDFDRIRDEMAALHLTVLVNCAGSGPRPAAFGALESYARDDVLATLLLNAAFPTLLTAALLPVLRGRHYPGQGKTKPGGGGDGGGGGRRKRALVINIGSVTDDGFPLVSFYSAGKAATHALHKALAREAALEGTGTEIISHRVAAVTGVSHTRAPPTLFRPHARTLARAVLARTGCGRKSVVPYWPHALLDAILGLLPEGVLDGIVNAAMREERVQERAGKR